jgi:hypothetical protein
MSETLIIAIDLTRNKLLERINVGYQKLITQGASQIEMRVIHDDNDPAGYEIILVGVGMLHGDTDVPCPKPCENCHQ